MRLSKFLLSLNELGEVSVAADLQPFADSELQQSRSLLEQLYQYDLQEMPAQAPEFDAQAALWAAQQLYRITQLLLQRSWGPEVIDQQLQPYPHTLNAAAIYSADLCLRHLPILSRLAKGLAPSDHLVTKLQQLAAQFPFSSVGIVLQETELAITAILDHPSLRYAYIDRIIANKDKNRIEPAPVQALIKSQLGNYTASYWPAINEQLKP